VIRVISMDSDMALRMVLLSNVTCSPANKHGSKLQPQYVAKQLASVWTQITALLQQPSCFKTQKLMHAIRKPSALNGQADISKGKTTPSMGKS